MAPEKLEPRGEERFKLLCAEAGSGEQRNQLSSYPRFATQELVCQVRESYQKTGLRFLPARLERRSHPLGARNGGMNFVKELRAHLLLEKGEQRSQTSFHRLRIDTGSLCDGSDGIGHLRFLPLIGRPTTRGETRRTWPDETCLRREAARSLSDGPKKNGPFRSASRAWILDLRVAESLIWLSSSSPSCQVKTFT
jgi:hypothetical protein